ncbi:MAG: DUF1778 domain-containing protein [Nitrospira sp.]
MAPTFEAMKTARFEARITEQQKALFQRAAELTGRSLTDFVVASAQETASRTLREHEALVLSARDREAFVAALLNAPAPVPRLRKAVRRYRERQHHGVNAR